MSGFLGEYRCKLDAKGRVIFPAALRHQNTSDDRSSFVLKRAIFGRCLELFTQEAFEQERDYLKSRINRYSERGDAFWRKFFRSAESIRLDSSDRILLSRRWLDEISATGELVFLGVDDRIEIWDAASYDSQDLDQTTYAEMSELIFGELNRGDE